MKIFTQLKFLYRRKRNERESEHEIGENGGKPSEVTVEGERGDVVGKEVEETHLDEETENNSGTEKSSDTTNEVKEPTSPEEQTDS